MDVSTDIVNDPKFRRLHRQNPEHVLAGFLAYVAILGESWKAGRRVPIVDSWPVILPFDAAVIASMEAAELLDSKGLIPSKTWIGWFTPAQKRRKATRERWRRANEKRLAESVNNSGSTALPPRGNHADTGAIPSVRPSVRPKDSPLPPKGARDRSRRKNGQGPRQLREGNPSIDAKVLTSLEERTAAWNATHPNDPLPVRGDA
jgi:hypothetical protein